MDTSKEFTVSLHLVTATLATQGAVQASHCSAGVFCPTGIQRTMTMIGWRRRLAKGPPIGSYRNFPKPCKHIFVHSSCCLKPFLMVLRSLRTARELQENKTEQKLSIGVFQEQWFEKVMQDFPSLVRGWAFVPLQVCQEMPRDADLM